MFLTCVLHNLGESLGSNVKAQFVQFAMEFSQQSMAHISAWQGNLELHKAIPQCGCFINWNHPNRRTTCQDLRVMGDQNGPARKTHEVLWKHKETCVEFCGFWVFEHLCLRNLQLRTGSHASMQMILQESQQSKFCKKTPKGGRTSEHWKDLEGKNKSTVLLHDAYRS